MINITNEDNMALMSRYPDKYFDLAIVDPPYGIGMDGGNHPKGIANCFDKRNGLSNSIKRNNYTSKEWDKSSPNSEYFNELIRVSKNQIIWGANHFISKIPYNSSCWIIWDKCNVGTNQSDCELAWSSFNTTVRKFSFMWSGAWQGSNSDGTKMEGNKKLNEKRIHPTQKPVKLYKWILDKYAKPNDKILDTHLGSGSIAIACHDYGFDLTACELDKEYYDKAMIRLTNHTNQVKLF